MQQVKFDFTLDDAPHHVIDDWTFHRAPTRNHVHCYHDYPARMIPQIAHRILCDFGDDAQLVLDPYCGSGTSLVESKIRGIDAIGLDLNPLARLISTAKTTPPSLKRLDHEMDRVYKFISSDPRGPLIKEVEGINNLQFWFKPSAIRKLSWLVEHIRSIDDPPVANFFRVAFSECARESSNSRSNEFKLYRYPPDKLASFKPDVFGLFLSKLTRNRAGLGDFLRLTKNLPASKSVVYPYNSVHGIPEDAVAHESVDLVVTSPPYGDSRTTVAYGQYSRLSAAWLGLEEPHNIDRRLMGGDILRAVSDYPCEELRNSIQKIARESEKRAAEVESFYVDLWRSITNVARTIRPGGRACYVVGNRKVKGVVLPTSQAIVDFFSHCGFDHTATYLRSIPNKRMPLKNSPSNKPGLLDATMTAEHIIVMTKR